MHKQAWPVFSPLRVQRCQRHQAARCIQSAAIRGGADTSPQRRFPSGACRALCRLASRWAAPVGTGSSLWSICRRTAAEHAGRGAVRQVCPDTACHAGPQTGECGGRGAPLTYLLNALQPTLCVNLLKQTHGWRGAAVAPSWNPERTYGWAERCFSLLICGSQSCCTQSTQRCHLQAINLPHPPATVCPLAIAGACVTMPRRNSRFTS